MLVLMKDVSSVGKRANIRRENDFFFPRAGLSILHCAIALPLALRMLACTDWHRVKAEVFSSSTKSCR
jgi:hypothetical protein